MYLKRLSIQGFKSFANRTSFDYGRGVTAVVGPNGSGKSNVSDAIRWVLGEQSTRLLRAKRQEDVIFAGTGSRAPVGMAEVILTLDNEEHWLPLDFAEVEIGRRVYRSGESEYLLNGRRVRLRDILDLLMKGDVGQNSYSIMGQGLVDEVLSMSPDDRRSFLDEAADVKRFRMKVKEAQDRLSANRENTDRIALIVREIAPRLTQLSRQAERAADHRRLSAELAELLLTSYGHRWAEAQNALVRARAALDQRAAEDLAAGGSVEQLREQIRTLGDEIRKRRESIARTDGRKAEVERRVASAKQSLALDTERQAVLAERRAEIAAEIQALEIEHATLATNIPGGPEGEAANAAAATDELARCRATLESAEREYTAARRALQDLRDADEAAARRLRGTDKDLAQARRRADELATALDRAVGRRRQLIAELVGYGRRYADAYAVVSHDEGAVDVARVAADMARERLVRVQGELRGYEAASNDELRELDYLEGRLEALQRVHAEHEDVAAGTRSVLAMASDAHGDPRHGQAAGILGLLSRQLRVPAELEIAINAALEHRLHAVIVEDDDAAFDAISNLREQRLGRAQFLPLRTMRHVPPVNLQKEKGVVGVASRLVRCERRYQGIADTFLGRVIVVEDLATGQRMIQRGLGSVVTLDGTVIDPSGVISGGALGSDEGAFARQRELDELPAHIEALRHRTATSSRQLENARLAIEQLDARVTEAEASYDELRRNVETARFEVTRERDRLHRLRREMDVARGREADLARESAAGATLTVDLTDLGRELTASRAESTSRIAAAETAHATAADSREAALTAVSHAGARLAALEGERRALAALRAQHSQAVERLARQIESRRTQAANAASEEQALAGRILGLQRELEAAAAEQALQGDDAAPDRDELHRLENHERQVQDQLGEAQAELLRLDRRRLDTEAEVARALALIEQLRSDMDREGLTPDAAGRILDTRESLPVDDYSDATSIRGGADIDIVAAESRIQELRRQIRRLGPINDDAPEDYDELQERHTFLTSQLADLEAAEEQLRAAIVELNQEIRVRFVSTFENVNRSFGQYFEAFFGGGSANLALTDPDNVAESGIEIEAQPPGKRLRSLSLLSGGERSLTAVALLFALLTANPAPFCVLDEVDAALDEANVGRFTAALRQLAEKTQFLVVTHNRRTVEIADAIYGVSMMRDGVSKVLSLRIGDLPQD